jgi:conjugal transfer pilus assembly protein TraF
MLQHPELNSKSANPMVGDARSELGRERMPSAVLSARPWQRIRARHVLAFDLRLLPRAVADRPALPGGDGLAGHALDLDKRPDLSARFGVEITPTMVIRRGSQQRMIIASGVEAYPNLAQMAYQAVRLLRGDIRPEQFMTGPGGMPASSMRWATVRSRRPIPGPRRRSGRAGTGKP